MMEVTCPTPAAASNCFSKLQASYRSSVFLQKVGETLQLLNLYLNQPFYRSFEVATQCFMVKENQDPTFHRYSKIALVLIFSPAPIAMHLVAGVSMTVGKIIAPHPYYLIEGRPSIPMQKRLTIGSWNICAFWGGLPTIFGGCLPARMRWKKIAATIKEMDFDLLLLQEASFETGEKLAKLISQQYSHIYTNSVSFRAYSKTIFTSAGPELVIASKYPVLQAKFIPFPEKEDLSLKQGVFAIELEKCWVINAHFPDGDSEDRIVRSRHQKILSFLCAEAANWKKPTFLCGDLNIRYENRKNDEYAELVENQFLDPYQKSHPEHNEMTATCTNIHPLIGQTNEEKPFERDDYILLVKNGCEKQVKNLIPTTPKTRIDHKLSDHKPIGLSITFL